MTACLLLVPSSVRASTPGPYSGSATGLIVTVPGVLNVQIGATGQLPSSGGSITTAPILGVNLGGGAVLANVLPSSTSGMNGTATSSAQVTDLGVNLIALDVSATVASSTATATCGPNGAMVSGSSVVTSLVVNGKSITVTGAPNQTITIPLIGKVVINEQQTGSSGKGNKGMTVDALHITLLDGTANVIVAQSHADITCNPTAAFYSRLSVHATSRRSTLHWYSAGKVAGFNVYDGKTRLNQQLVVSRTRWYHFSTSRSLRHVRIIAVLPNGSTV